MLETQKIIDALTLSSLTSGFNADDIKILAQKSSIKHFEPGSYLMYEKELSNEMYIVVSGKLSLEKMDENDHEYNIGYLVAGDVVGELSFLENVPRYCSVKTEEETTVIKISKEDLLEDAANGKKIINHLAINIASSLSKKIKLTNERYIDKLRAENANLKKTVNFGHFFVIIVASLGLSSIFVNILVTYKTGFDIRSVTFNWVYLLILLVPILFFVLKSSYSFSTFGINRCNLKRTVLESCLIIVFIGPILFFSTGYKLSQFFVHFLNIGAFSYLLHSAVQEFVARGVVQTTLFNFMSKRNNDLVPIVLAAFIFSMFHLQIGLEAVYITFVAGILFGYLYYRQGNIFGVTFVHFVLGWIALGKVV